MNDKCAPSSNQDLPRLLREAERRVNNHVFKRDGDSALASIPANPERDVDILLMRAADEIERLRAALKKAKPIVGAACASAGATGSNDSRRLREKVYTEICEALGSTVETKSLTEEPK